MADRPGIRLAVVGLHFGAEFVPIYQAHPDVEQVAVCDLNEPLLHQVADTFGIVDRFTRLEDILRADKYNAVHLLTPVPLHVEQTLAQFTWGGHGGSHPHLCTSLSAASSKNVLPPLTL